MSDRSHVIAKRMCITSECMWSSCTATNGENRPEDTLYACVMMIV